MSYRYRIWIAEKQDEADNRDWPTTKDCFKLFKEWKGLPVKGVMNIGLTSEEIVEFHHLRRKHNVCSRVKWELLDDA